jgi:hypothetical protein
MEGLEWIHVAQNTNQRRALMNTVMVFEFYEMLVICCVALRLVASQEVFSSIDLGVS